MENEERPEPPLNGDEVGTLLGFLNYQRATLEWRCGGLDATQLSATTSASSLTLGGLLKHMAFVEDEWMTRWLPGADRVEPWASTDWELEPEWDLESARNDAPEQLFALWRASVIRSNGQIQTALDGDGLGAVAVRSWPDGRSPSLRWILVHMIEEYARHNGHADFLRESIDGVTGE